MKSSESNTTFFPIKEEQPQNQHKYLGCCMLLSGSGLICAWEAKAAQPYQSCCWCFQTVWLGGTNGSLFSSTADD